ncbi:MAG: NAD(P)-binding domain-containing protein, partial [Lachnospiraceae bacterium]|nr:NAD(P)-binding domain-containing protein [Lachnospiraceae bacterium]
MKIGFIGMGNMAKAIAAGFISSKKVAAADLYAYAPTKDKLNNNSREIGFTACESATEVVNASDIVILACKPYQIKSVLDEIGSALSGKALVSIAAGWTFKSFEDILGDKAMIQCIMPNTPAMVGEGVMLFEAKNSLSDELAAYI